MSNYKILISPEVALDYQEVLVVANAEILPSTQDWEKDPYDVLANADTLELEANGKRYPIPLFSDLEQEVFDIILEKISPT